ncbi:DNA internalization-related competence protein ComEC/Rec2 [bacterium]|nr:DNA internalization-related competence protein ComEC/Rec2 [bacterium]
MEQTRDPLRLYPAVKVVLLFILIILIIRYTGISSRFVAGHSLIFSLAAIGLITGAALLRCHMRMLAFLFFISGVFFLISARYPSGKFESSHISHFNQLGREVEVKGIVSRDPQAIKGNIRFVFEARSIRVTQHIGYPSTGQLLITLRDQARMPIRYGEELTLYGRIFAPRNERNPGEFDYAQYLAFQDIYGLMYLSEPGQVNATRHTESNPILKYFIHPIKHYVSELNNSTLSPLSASILTGLLVGERGEIPSEVLEYFSYSGTIHILSISGLHIVFVTALLFGFFSFIRLPYNLRIYFTLACLAVYMGVADFIPSVVRAGIMAAVVLVGTLRQVRGNIINSLFVSLIIILFMQPLALFDIGLQLSFTAVLSIVLIYPKLETACKRFGFFQSGHMSLSEKILALLLVSVAAQIGTIPFTAYYFYKIPLAALAANVLIVPLSSFVMGIGFISAIIGTFSITIAQWFANVNELSILLMVKIAEWSSKMPFAYMEFYKMNLWSMLIFYTILFYFLTWHALKIRKYGMIAGLAVIAIFMWRPVWSSEQPLEIIFLDVGQGDAAVVRTPQNKTILIDAGDCNEHFDQGERVVAPYLRKIGVHHIDYLIMSHPHDDHIGGMFYLLKHFTVGNVIDPGQFYRSDVYDSILCEIERRRIPRRIMRAGDALAIDKDVALYFMHPGKQFVSENTPAPAGTNNSSLVFQLRYRGVKALFMGDAELPSLSEISDYSETLQSDILKVGHHGSWNGTSQTFLSKVQPKFAVISCGEFNMFNHPSPAVVGDLINGGAKVYRTDQQGAVIFRANVSGIHRVR